MTKKKDLHLKAAHFIVAIDCIHPNWRDCRGSAIVMNRAYRILGKSRVTIQELLKVGRSLYRLWSVFKKDYSDRKLVSFLEDRATAFKGV